MTQPAPPAQQQQQLALAVASALATASTAAGATAILGPAIVRYKITSWALAAMLDIVMSHPPDAEGFYGPAGAQVARVNLIRRAMFGVSCLFRLNGDYARMRAGGEVSWQDVLTRERRFYGQHLAAGWARTRAGAQVDSASMLYGRLLGWHTVTDTRTSPECLAANRRNFYADKMPRIGFPGMVHPYCRCLPGTPFPGAPLVGAARVLPRGRPVSDHRSQPRTALSGVR
jgi:hypothetical protein